MFRSARQRTELPAYEYNRQATDDHEEDHGQAFMVAEKRRVPRGKRPNYKPTALTWPFIVTQILVLGLTIGLIVWAEKAMPDSDSTAIVDPVPSQALRALPGRLVRAEYAKQFRRDNTSSAVVETTRTHVELTSSTGSDQDATPSSSGVLGPTDLSGGAETTKIGTTGLSSTVISAEVTVTDRRDSTVLSETASSTTPPGSSSSPTLITSDDASSGTSKSSGTASGTADTVTSAISTTSAGESSSFDGHSSAAGTSSIRHTSTFTPTSSGLVSSSTFRSKQSNKDDRISFLVDPTATENTTSLITSIFTSDFTTTAKSSINLTRTVTIPEYTTTFNVTRSTVFTTDRTTTGNSTLPPSTVPVSYTTTETYSSTTVYSSIGFESYEGPSTTVLVSEFTSVVVSFTVIAPSTVDSEVVEPITVTSIGVFPTTSEVPATTSQTVIQTYVPYLSTGQTVITSVATVIILAPQTQAKSQAPVTVVGTSVEGGQVHTVVETFAPQTKVVGDNSGPITQVSTPPPQTIVSQVGGTVTTNYIVITPIPTTQMEISSVETIVGGESRLVIQTQAPQTIFTSQGGSLVILTTTPAPQTRVTVIGGTITSFPVTSTSTGFQPISYFITTNIGGSTRVIIATQAPTKVVTTINGTPVTFDAILPPRTYTTTFDSSLVTELTVTTPTASEPITLTFVSTISGSLTTIIQTFAPSTYLISNSGHLSTIITTPSPSTYLSTAAPSTRTFTTTSSLSSTSTSPAPAQTYLLLTTKTYNLSSREYFTGTFLPPFVAVALVIPLRILDLNAKLYQPFNSLASPSGASGYDALTLQFTGLTGFLTPATTILQGRPVPFITTLLVLFASLTVPLAVEAISLKLHGHCSPLSSHGCAAALGVSPASAHALLVLLAILIILLILLLFILRNWATNLHANPWNLAGIASLARNPDVHIHATDDEGVRRFVAEKQYGLGYYVAPDGREEYGLLLLDDSGRGLASATETENENQTSYFHRDRKAKALPFMTLRYPWQAVFLGYLLGLLVLIAYYDYTLVVQVADPTVPRYTRFHLYLDSHDFGIRFLFAGLGVIITFCWQAFFVAVATLIPFHTLSHHHQPANKSILVSRPTNAFYGLYLACKLRHPFYIATSLITILSEFLPILLSNIPHKLTQVLLPTLVCTRVSLAFLALMVLTVIWGFFVRWPPMPVDPRSVAGMVWYVCRSRMLADFGGLAEMGGKERDKRVEEMGGRYYYGELLGAGTGRVGVDKEMGLGEREGVSTAYEPGGREVWGLDPAPNDGSGFRLRVDAPVDGRGYGTVRTGQDVVRSVLGRREEGD